MCVGFYLHVNFLSPVSSTILVIRFIIFFSMCSLMLPPALGWFCLCNSSRTVMPCARVLLSYSGSSREYGGEIVRKGVVRYGGRQGDVKGKEL